MKPWFLLLYFVEVKYTSVGIHVLRIIRLAHVQTREKKTVKHTPLFWIFHEQKWCENGYKFNYRYVNTKLLLKSARAVWANETRRASNTRFER